MYLNICLNKLASKNGNRIAIFFIYIVWSSENVRAIMFWIIHGRFFFFC